MDSLSSGQDERIFFSKEKNLKDLEKEDKFKEAYAVWS
jgi:hypothetical protein